MLNKMFHKIMDFFDYIDISDQECGCDKKWKNDPQPTYEELYPIEIIDENENYICYISKYTYPNRINKLFKEAIKSFKRVYMSSSLANSMVFELKFNDKEVPYIIRKLRFFKDSMIPDFINELERRLEEDSYEGEV
jgi:hypothetical protein